VSAAAGRGVWRAVRLALAVAFVTGCAGGDRKPNEFRMTTESFSIRITPDPSPPRALEQVQWTVVVNDKATGMPIDGGEGRIFASSRDGKNIANGFAATDQVGTYRTTLLYVTAGTWAMGVQFRRDSMQVLERTEDWTQDVRTGDEPGEYALPSTQTPTQLVDTVRRDSTAPEGAALPR
jgi:hypothetical protein